MECQEYSSVIAAVKQQVSVQESQRVPCDYTQIARESVWESWVSSSLPMLSTRKSSVEYSSWAKYRARWSWYSRMVDEHRAALQDRAISFERDSTSWPNAPNRYDRPAPIQLTPPPRLRTATRRLERGRFPTTFSKKRIHLRAFS